MRSGARFAALWAGMSAVAVSGILSVAALDCAVAVRAEERDALGEALEQAVADGFPGVVAYARDEAGESYGQ